MGYSLQTVAEKITETTRYGFETDQGLVDLDEGREGPHYPQAIGIEV